MTGLINLYDFLSLQDTPPKPEKGKRILKTDKLPEFPNQIKGEKYIDYKDFEGYFSNQFEEEYQEPQKVPFRNINEQEITYDPLEVELACLDIEKDILDDFTVVIVGRRRSGKTFLARWLMYHLKHRFPAGVVITGTKLNKYWQNYVPSEFVTDIEDIGDTLSSVYQRQTIIREHPELGIDPRFFIILDDVMSDKYRVRFSKQLSKAFTDGRHYGIFTLITCQDPFGIGPDLRENADLVIVFRQNQQSRKEAVGDNYMDSIYTKKTRPLFLWDHTTRLDPSTGEPMDQSTATDEEIEKGIPQALVINQAKNTEDFCQYFKKVIANEPEDFILGDIDFWRAQKSGDWSKTLNTAK